MRISILVPKDTIVGQYYPRAAYFGSFQSYVSYELLLLWGHSYHVHDVILFLKKTIRILAEAGFLEHCRSFLSHKQFILLSISTFFRFSHNTNLIYSTQGFTITTHGTYQRSTYLITDLQLLQVIIL